MLATAKILQNSFFFFRINVQLNLSSLIWISTCYYHCSKYEMFKGEPLHHLNLTGLLADIALHWSVLSSRQTSVLAACCCTHRCCVTIVTSAMMTEWDHTIQPARVRPINVCLCANRFFFKTITTLKLSQVQQKNVIEIYKKITHPNVLLKLHILNLLASFSLPPLKSLRLCFPSMSISLPTPLLSFLHFHSNSREETLLLTQAEGNQGTEGARAQWKSHKPKEH